jgi:hypothetical protein
MISLLDHENSECVIDRHFEMGGSMRMALVYMTAGTLGLLGFLLGLVAGIDIMIGY